MLFSPFYGGLIDEKFYTPKLAVRDGFMLDSEAVPCSRLTEVLDKSPNPSSVTALMRSKFFVVRGGADEREYSEWLSIVLEILENDSSYDPDFIPLTVDTASVILKKVRKIRQLKDSHAKMELKAEKELSDYRRGIEIEHVEKDARSVMEVAVGRLDADLEQLEEFHENSVAVQSYFTVEREAGH